MNLFKEFHEAWKETYQLQPKYYWVTNFVGLLSMLAGLAIMSFVGQPISFYLNINPHECIKCQASGITWIVLFIAVMPLTLYLGVAIAVGIFGGALYFRGKISKTELKKYVLFSRYPKYWFKNNA